MSNAELLDTFFRLASIGQLTLLAAGLLFKRAFTFRSVSLLVLCPCVAAYLLLTAPVDEYYSGLRNGLMVLTHAMPFVLWALGTSIFDERFRPWQWPLPAKILIGLYAVWHVFFFGYLGGDGSFHDFSDWVAVVLAAHLIYMAIEGLRDDLLEPRRRLRMLLLAFVALQVLTIALVEIARIDVGDPRIVGAANAAVFLLVISVVTIHVLSSSPAEILAAPPDQPSPAAKEVGADPDALDSRLREKLTAFMDSGGYRQADLTIKRLADELSVPEHRLRNLINRGLGYRNFSAFVNSYRIPAACEQLSDGNRAHVPVLSIALGLGYGSIGPFNRAFKAAVGQTPTEFRGSRHDSSKADDRAPPRAASGAGIHGRLRNRS